MERFFNRFTEIHEQLRPYYLNEFEVQATVLMSGLTFGSSQVTLFDDRERGLKLYHHGPEIRRVIHLPFWLEEKTGNEYVFFEYHNELGSFHLVGSVNPLREFRLVGLDRYEDGRGYGRVSVRAHREVVQHVTLILNEIMSV